MSNGGTKTLQFKSDEIDLLCLSLEHWKAALDNAASNTLAQQYSRVYTKSRINAMILKLGRLPSKERS